jgi:hypothetical protein
LSDYSIGNGEYIIIERLSKMGADRLVLICYNGDFNFLTSLFPEKRFHWTGSSLLITDQQKQENAFCL